MTDGPKIIRGGRALDDRGALTFCNDFQLVGCKRFYVVRNHRRGLVRAWHGHRLHDTFLWPLEGDWHAATVPVDGCLAGVEHFWFAPGEVLHVPAGHYHGTQSLSGEALLGVFSTATLEQVKEDDVRLPWDWWPSVWGERQR